MRTTMPPAVSMATLRKPRPRMCSGATGRRSGKRCSMAMAIASRSSRLDSEERFMPLLGGTLSVDHRSQLQDSVPVAAGAARTEFVFDELVRELRTADAGGVDDVDVLAACAHRLRTLDRGL